MNVYHDEATGYLIIDDISDGVDILPSELYQSYLKQIKDLTEQNRDLQSRLNDMGAKLADKESIEKELYTTKVMYKTLGEIMQKSLDDERKKSDQLLVSVGVLYDRLETVKNAHYIEGYADGAWQCQHRELNDVGKQLQKDVASFPKLLESALGDIKNIISKD